MQKRRFAVVGTGGRSINFTQPILTDFSDEAEVVALCDISQVRMRFWQKELDDLFGCGQIPCYRAQDFVTMIREHKVDEVIVCTMDSTHDEYIVTALDSGCDVTTEKPLTTDAAKCQRIIDAVERTGKNLRVAFNYRWAAANTKVKELIDSGVIGNVRHVSMEYALDTRHGADYFRRWHSYKDKSGGLLVHKSTHHFDLINWWTNSIPEQVFAYGDLVYYGRENAIKRGDEELTRYPRYTGAASQNDPFRMDLAAHPRTKALYLDAESETGYLRDENVFRPGIDIEDSMTVAVRYRNGMMLSYCLNAFSPVEGMRVIFHGDRGRIEFAHFGGSHLILGQSGEELEQMQDKNKGFEELVVIPHFAPRQYHEIPKAKGGHGGGDTELAKRIFMHSPPTDPWHRNAGHEQGAASILVGIAANQSIATNQPVTISDLVSLNPKAERLEDLV